VHGNVYLTGLSGSGKSTVAPIVAALLKYRSIDADAEIAAREGHSIARIFAERGETAFREIERAAIERIARESSVVVALGGGAIVLESSRALLTATGTLVHLAATVSTLVDRVGTSGDRPLLAGDARERLARLHTERAGLYASAAFAVATDGRAPASIAREIVDTLAQRATAAR